MKAAHLAASMLSATLAGGALGAAAYLHFFPDSQALPGTAVDGYPPPRDRPLAQYLEDCRRRWLLREAYLAAEDDTIPVRFEDLGLELDVTETEARVRNYCQAEGLWTRARRAVSAWRGDVDLQPAWSFDAARARALLEQIAARVARDPVDASLDLRGHRRIEDVPGLRLDVARSLESIAQGSRDDGAVFELALERLPARVTSDMLVDVDVDRVLSSYTTSFRHKAGARAVNIATAARYLNGTVMGPGQTLSFNAVVGHRTEERGFIEAPVIVEDEFERDVGGGVCQVATTLHAAAVFGLLEVVRRRSHSRPSGYAPLGLDATVIDNEVDLRIKNPYDTSLIVHAFLPDPYTIRVELLGKSAPGKVEHRYAVVTKHEFSRRVRRMPDIATGQPQRKQKGNPGYDVVSVVSVSTPKGREVRRRYKSKYYPVPEVFWTSMDEPLDQLPPQPEGSTGVDVLLPGEAAVPAASEESSRSADPSPDPYEQPLWASERH